MSREIKNDFKKLLEFIKSYNLSGQISDQNLIKFLSQIHKKYYSLLTFVMELISMVDDDGNKLLNKKQRDYILESVSDIGNAVFLIINGAYKPSKLMLRSAIETFFKGVSIEDINDIDKEKRIYQMFEKIGEIDFFKQDETNKNLYDQLTSMYSELSKDIHTAGNNHMQHTSSLDYFPSKSIPKLKNTSTFLNNISQVILTILTIKFNSEFHKMHYSNKTIIINSIKRKYRQKIHNIE